MNTNMNENKDSLTRNLQLVHVYLTDFPKMKSLYSTFHYLFFPWKNTSCPIVPRLQRYRVYLKLKFPRNFHFECTYFIMRNNVAGKRSSIGISRTVNAYGRSMLVLSKRDCRISAGYSLSIETLALKKKKRRKNRIRLEIKSVEN